MDLAPRIVGKGQMRGEGGRVKQSIG